ncbi:MAG: nucleotidyltransferase family protein [bacterium]|nr:nucleotidyltransferase family protein [bacterium]
MINADMKTIEEINQTLSKLKPKLIKNYEIKEIGVFGSYMRGDQKSQSDIDILVDFEEYPSLLEFVGIEEELSKFLGIKVDLVMKTGLKPHIGKHILHEVRYL